MTGDSSSGCYMFLMFFDKFCYDMMNYYDDDGCFD